MMRVNIVLVVMGIGFFTVVAASGDMKAGTTTVQHRGGELGGGVLQIGLPTL